MRFRTNLYVKKDIISPVAFVDVVVLFIVFFALAGRSEGKTGIVLAMPEVEQAELYEADSLAVELKGEKIFAGEEEIDIARLRKMVSEKPVRLLAIRADKKVQYSLVMQVVSVLRSAGIKRIAFAAEQKKK